MNTKTQRWQVLAAVVVAAMMILVGNAQACPIDWDPDSPEWLDSSPLNLCASCWSWDDTTLTWDISEDYIADHVDDCVLGFVGQADVDPTIHVVKTITNNSTFVWTDYHVVITGSEGVSYDAGSAGSDVFGTIVEDGNTIDFYAPNSVPIGSNVTIWFDIIIPAGGFTFDISQTPTPEPATMSLLVLGGLALIRRRRK